REHALDLRRLARLEDVAALADHARHAGRAQGRLHLLALRVDADKNRQVAGPQRPLADPVAARKQTADLVDGGLDEAGFEPALRLGPAVQLALEGPPHERAPVVARERLGVGAGAWGDGLVGDVIVDERAGGL